MPRKKIPISNEFPYHVGSRCINKEWFNIPPAVLWEIFSEQLYFLDKAFDFRINAFVLMTNHYHMLCQTPAGNLASGMQYFNTQTSKLLCKESGRINHIYGSRFFRSQIKSNHYFEHAYKYVYRNPVCAKITDRVEDYRWSTLHGHLGLSHQFIPTVDDTILFNETSQTLNWLNQDYAKGHREAIRNALRKSEFKFPLVRCNGKNAVAHELEVVRS